MLHDQPESPDSNVLIDISEIPLQHQFQVHSMDVTIDSLSHQQAIFFAKQYMRLYEKTRHSVTLLANWDVKK